MIKLMRRFWKYVTAGANQKFNEKADPKIQLQQAIDEAQRNHRVLTEQAAKSHRQLLGEVSDHHQSAQLPLEMWPVSACTPRVADSGCTVQDLPDFVPSIIGDRRKFARHRDTAQSLCEAAHHRVAESQIQCAAVDGGQADSNSHQGLGKSFER